jgi:hypothetical protein
VLTVVIIVVVFAIFVIGIFLRRLIARGYRRELQAWATSRGWTYRETGGGDWANYLPQGERRTGVEYELDRDWEGHVLTLADYWYEIVHQDEHGATNTRTEHLTVMVVQLAMAYPSLVLHSRTLGGLGLGVAKAVGMHTDNLTGIPEFDSHYRVEASWPGASEVLTTQVVQATLQGHLPAWQLHGNSLIVSWPGQINVPDLDQHLSWVLALALQLDKPS